MAHIFIDESGNFGDGDEDKYFLLGSFIVGSPKRTDKDFKSWKGNKLPRRMRRQSEVKWSATGIDDSLRLKTIKAISDMDVRIRYGYVEKRKIEKARLNKPGHLYADMVGDLVEMYFPPTETELYIICDQRKLKGLTPMEFKKLLRKRLIPKAPPKTKIEVEMVNSNASNNIQIADWIVGALARFHEGKALGVEAYTLLKNNLLDEGKLFL